MADRPCTAVNFFNPWGPRGSVSLLTWANPGLPSSAVVNTTHLPSTAQGFNPWGPQYPVALRTWLQPKLIPFVGPPFYQNAWPNPSTGPAPAVALRTWLQPVTQPPAAGASFRQSDWPNPVGPIFPSGLRTWTLGDCLLRVAEIPDTTHLPSSAIWFNPWGAAYPVALRTFLQGTSFRTPFVATAIFNQRDWPNPTLARRGAPIDWIWSVDLSFATSPFNQYDWPVPIGPLPTNLRTFINPGGQVYVVNQDKLPFRQSEWPVPIGPLYPMALRTWTASPNQYAPLRQLDWPNPSRGAQPASDLRTFLNQGGQRYLINQDVLPPRQLDWPVPKGPLFPVDLLTWLNRPQLLQPIKGFLNSDWPNPIGPVYPIELRTWLQLGPGSLIPPFRLTDWPVPKGPLFPVDLLTFINQGGQRYLLGKDSLPYNQRDWVNPRGPAYPQDLRSWWNKGLPSRPFAQLDWPVPKGPAYAISLRTSLNSPFAKPNPPPTNYDWPNPRGPVYPVSLRSHWAVAQLPAISPGDSTHLPSTAIEWFNPWAPKRSVDLLTSIGVSVALDNRIARVPTVWRYTPVSAFVAVNAQNWVRNFQAPPATPGDTTHLPGAVSEWINLLGPPRSVSLLTIGQEPIKFINRISRPPTYYRYVPVSGKVAINAQSWLVRNYFLIPPVPDDTTHLPSTAIEWFNPWGPKQPVLDWSSQNQNLQPPAVTPQFPVSNRDWPNPGVAVPATTLKTWLDQTRIQLIGQDQLPLRQLDWPNPRGAQQPVVDLVNNGFGIQLIPPAAPFNQTEWPNPRGALRQNPDWISSVTVDTLQAIPPRVQSDWPVPRGPVYNLNVLSQASTILFQIAAPPFAQLDWPVPNGYIPALENKTFINQGGQRYLTNQDKINARQSEWPVPAGYIPANSLKTFINNGGQLLLNGQDRFFGLAGNPNFDWPVPKGPKPNDIYNFSLSPYIENIPPGPPPVPDTFHFLPFLATMGPISAR